MSSKMTEPRFQLYYWPIPFRGCFVSYLFAYRDVPLLEKTGFEENINLKNRVSEKEASARFIGQSLPFKRFYESLKTIAKSDYTVLIRGESGTGKELAAHGVHDLSSRKNKQLVVVNCPAIPEHLLESELFGHKRGAFTGADHDHKGMFDEADGGTICLDEIGDIPISIQTKLLRVLQEQEIKPLGAVKSHKVNVRVVAITNQDLEMKISERSFREDLFYRLNVVALRTPSLAEIREDIPLLANHFVRLVCRELDIPEKSLSKEAIKSLMERDWPGNVRELQNGVRHAVLFAKGEVIGPEDFKVPTVMPGSSAATPFKSQVTFDKNKCESYKEAKERVVNDFTSQYVSELLESTNGNVTKAAETAGLSRAALQKIMKRFDIKSYSFRD
jgi:transcriptional regulator with GAF, ATPase, and Fis domain